MRRAIIGPRAKAQRRRRRAMVRRFRRKVYGSSVYHFTEPYNAGTGTAIPQINVAGTSSSGGQMTFALNNLTNIASYKNLFDLYKINKVQVKIIPYANVNATNQTGIGPGQGSLPLLYIAPNKDYWMGSPSSSADVLNDDGCRVITVSKPVTFTLKYPRPNVVDNSGTTISYGILPNKVGQWLSTGGNAQKLDQSGVQYYGFRWWCDNFNSTSFIPQVIVKVFFSMKERD